MENKTKHTPAPWKTNIRNKQSVNSIGLIIEPNGHSDTTPIAFSLGFSSEECIANAKLIAAAPELLELLKNALTVIPYGNETLVNKITNTLNEIND